MPSQPGRQARTARRRPSGPSRGRIRGEYRAPARRNHPYRSPARVPGGDYAFVGPAASPTQNPEIPMVAVLRTWVPAASQDLAAAGPELAPDLAPDRPHRGRGAVARAAMARLPAEFSPSRPHRRARASFRRSTASGTPPPSVNRTSVREALEVAPAAPPGPAPFAPRRPALAPPGPCPLAPPCPLATSGPAVAPPFAKAPSGPRIGSVPRVDSGRIRGAGRGTSGGRG